MNNSKVFQALCKSEGLPVPALEYKFHPKRKWRSDYYFEKDGIKVALEVEGGVWKKGKDGKLGGRHNRGVGFIKDLEKYNNYAMMGILLLRVQPKDLLKISTIEMLKKILL